MKKLLSVFLVFCVFLAFANSNVEAAGNKAFYKGEKGRGVSNPQDLSGVLRVSLSLDPSGMSLISPELCRKHGSCAKPMDYLEMLEEKNIHLKNISELPGFMAGLVKMPSPRGEHELACLVPKGDGTFIPLLKCMSRKFKPGETVWVDPETGLAILASDCTNPIADVLPMREPVPPPPPPVVKEKVVVVEKVEECVEIEFRARRGDIVSIASYREVSSSNPSPSVCWQPPTEECNCTFDEVRGFIPAEFSQLKTGQYVVHEDGIRVFRLPRVVAVSSYTALCIEREEFGHSHTLVVEPGDWSGEVTRVVSRSSGPNQWPTWLVPALE